jgi:hypothetical protein
VSVRGGYGLSGNQAFQLRTSDCAKTRFRPRICGLEPGFGDLCEFVLKVNGWYVSNAWDAREAVFVYDAFLAIRQFEMHARLLADRHAAKVS